MKHKFGKYLAIFLAVFVLVVCISSAFFFRKEKQNGFSKATITASTTLGYDKEASERIQKSHLLAEKVRNTIPQEIFGGLYFDENQTLIVNVTDLSADSVLRIISEESSDIIKFNKVDNSLESLESVRIQLIPYMSDYDIATLDANEMTNKIDIELYKENTDIEAFVSKYIDMEYVTISVLPEDLEIRLT